MFRNEWLEGVFALEKHVFATRRVCACLKERVVEEGVFAQFGLIFLFVVLTCAMASMKSSQSGSWIIWFSANGYCCT